jgi:hypothetical protein
MSESSYFLLLTKKDKSLKPLKKKFLELEGFYTGIGYAFPKKHVSTLKDIAVALEEKLYEMPLSKGQTFASLQQSHKSFFFQHKLYEIETLLLQFQQELGLEELSEESLHTRSSPIKDKVLDLMWEKERLQEALKHAKKVEKALEKPSLAIQFLHERSVNFLTEPSPDLPRLVSFLDNKGDAHPFIPRGCTGMLVGAGGIGKTHLLTQLGLSLVTGIPFLGKYPVEKPGFVFLGLGENTDADIHRLLQKTLWWMFSLVNRTPSLFDIEEISQRLAVQSFAGTKSCFLSQKTATPLYEAFLEALKSKEPEEGWSCIILDPISRFLGADAENDNASATLFIELLERLILELRGKPTVLFGHHMNKSGVMGSYTDQSAARGSSAITDGVRLQIHLEKIQKESQFEQEKICMRMVKSNFTAFIPDQFLIRNQDGNLGVEHSMTSSKEVKY